MSHGACSLWLTRPTWTLEKGNGLETDSDPEVFTMLGKVLRRQGINMVNYKKPLSCVLSLKLVSAISNLGLLRHI